LTPAVEMTGISKLFGNVAALHEVNLSVQPGHIHAIVGENGAGKTTLMKVLYGAHQPSNGQIQINGSVHSFKNCDEAISSGIGMVSQHYSIIPELTCLQNLLLGAEPGAVISYSAAEERANELAAQMGFEFNWQQEAAEISPSQGQKLEILKLLWRNVKILILDEPTAMLAPDDADLLYAKLHELTKAGATVLVVTHRLPEVMEHCDHVTVLRGGKLIDSCPVSETNPAEIAEKMVGQAVLDHSPIPCAPAETLLTVSGLTVKGDKGNDAVKSASFELRAGELVGIAGVDGNGQRELFYALMGTRSSVGTIDLLGSPITHATTAERIHAGLRLIAEDRHNEAVIEEWSIADNAILGLQRTPTLLSGRSINRRTQIDVAKSVTETFPTKFDNVNQPFRDLSGGNQQKVVAARALQQNPKVILAFQPTRGIDLYVAGLVYDGLIKASREGATVLVVSFDLDELMTYCDRILVMNHGEIAPVPANLRHDRQAIGRMMVGAQ